jgi:hypothetical protein
MGNYISCFRALDPVLDSLPPFTRLYLSSVHSYSISPVDRKNVFIEVTVADISQVDVAGAIHLVDGDVLHVRVGFALKGGRQQPLARLA